jgi:DNA invertase Pin-like site-specific DNA recombinase
VPTNQSQRLRQYLGLTDDQPLPELTGLGIRRISRDAGRKRAGKLHSDADQDARMYRIAGSWGVNLAGILDETNVPGDTPLEMRPYGDAIEQLEAGGIQVIVFAYDDRADRDVRIHQDAVDRIDAHDGILLAGEGEPITHKNADAWTYSTLRSVLNESQKRKIRERIHTNVERAVADGRVPYPSFPLGLESYGDHNHVRPVDDEKVLQVVRDAYMMRFEGETVDAVRAFLAANGWERSYRAVQRLLASPLYIGEIRYGGNKRKNGTVTPRYVKTGLFEPIVDPDVWEAVQRKRVPAGRRAKSVRLLARLEVLVCDSCEGRMIAGANVSPNGKRNTFYKCGRGRQTDCQKPATIHAERVEQFVVEQVKREAAEITESESAIREARDADQAAKTAEDAAELAEVRYLELGPGKHERAHAKVLELQVAASEARAYAEELAADFDVEWLDAARVLDNPDPAAVPAKRALIKSVMKGRVVVRPGRIPFDEKVAVTPRRKPRRAHTP